MPRFLATVCIAIATAWAVVLSSALPQAPAKPTTPTARQKGGRAIHARAILRKYCHDCHGGKEPKGTIAVSDHAKLVARGPNPVPFVLPGNVAKSQVIQLIEDGSMPPGGRQRPSDDEIAVLKEWITDSATHFPESFDADATLRLLLDDAARHPDDVPHIRYLSFTHLVRDDAPPPDLAAAERALFAALGECGLTQMPVPLDGPATLYRLDTRQAGWNSRELFVQESGGVYPLTPYDLLLLEYPHAVALPGSHSLTRQLDTYLAQAKLSRPVPLVRADWATAVLRKDSPLADDLKSLSDLHTELQKGEAAKLPCGPRPRAFGRLNPVPAAPKAESPQAILPLASWYSGDCRPTQPPITLTAELVDPNHKPLKAVTTGEAFQLRVNTDRSTHFALLMIWSNGQVSVQPTQQNGFLDAKETFLRPAEGAKEGFTIADILTGEKAATEYFVLLTAPKPLPKPVIVRSRHSRGLACEAKLQFPVYRFLFEENTAFDWSTVVRQVIPIPVTVPKGE